MPLFNKKKFPRFVSSALICALLSLGFTTCTHLFSRGKRQWVSLDREMRRIAYRAERLNLKSAINAEEDAPISDSAPQSFNIAVVQNILIAPYLLSTARQQDGKPDNRLRDHSPVLNL